MSLADDPRVSDCLAALADEVEPGQELELILVENRAMGAPPELPLEPAHRLRRPENPGFAESVNEGLALSRGELVLTLNPDAILTPGSLRRGVLALLRPGVGAVAFRLLRPGRLVLDSAGIRLGILRRARDRGMGGPAAGNFTRREPVDAACMACALFRREALDRARDGAGEILDSRFFAYKEDVDLGWRIRRAGYQVIYEPDAECLHERGWKEGARLGVPLHLRRLSYANRWHTIVKNETVLGFFWRAGLYLGFEVLVLGYLLLREPRVLLAWPRLLKDLPGSWRRRKLFRGGR